ncbi:BON domain-containing protein [Daejeonella oryzae]|uniref:BON domain-containing protein n=1 Tax=Daejeonella oryzae TaxID=1122943 RepID=UPI0004138FE9|nr:BON domain-containing protein [Daejeonella oryzae]
MKLKSFKNSIAVMMMMGLTLLYSCKQSDSQIQADSQAKVAVVDSDVSVAVSGGVVTLTGEVKDDQTKSAVGDAVKDVKGVKSVVNNTTVSSPEIVIDSDTELKSTLERTFTQKGINGVSFSVNNGEVTLNGEIDRADLVKVMQAANEANPKKVINQLTIKN